jgi:uncharacterized protein YdeI (YjbR/CyaY-like superfamily)
MEPTNVTVFPTPADFRAWLEANHASEREIWIGYYRKGVPKTAMTYAEAVEEALCFGWIDGQARRIDEEVTSNRFTPRRKTSNWSAINIAKVAQLKKAGRMHPSGLRAFEERDRSKDASYAYERPDLVLSEEWLARLRADPAAWEFWDSETPSFRRGATYWVMSAKREETRARRFETLVRDAAGGRRPAPFLVTREERNR